MKTRRLLVAGNWKMSGTSDSVKDLVSKLNAISINNAIDVAVFPTFLHLQDVRKQLQASIAVGAQDIAKMFDSVALTGEISGAQLKDAGSKYVLVGHSERRVIIGEDDVLLCSKLQAAQKYGLVPVLCVGETLEQYNNKQGRDVVKSQVNAVIQALGMQSLENMVIAYEPVWAIGTGLTATSEYAQGIHAELRSFIASFSADIASKITILYGGSVKASNAAELMVQLDIDGVLVGGASLIPEEFAGICAAAAQQA